MNQNYKIAVYAIACNEAVNVDKWMKSMWEADFICILDTGSTDGTYEKFQEYQRKWPGKVALERKEIKPWRFDVARNESMKLIPRDADICICTDIDEVLTPTWAQKLKDAWYPGCQRGFYLYAWSHKDNGEPSIIFWYDKIHDNSGSWSWKFPVHESLDNAVPTTKTTSLPRDFIALHHYPLPKASRSSYLPLLEQRAREYPDDGYGLIYLAHQYFYEGQYEKTIDYILNTALPHFINTDDDYFCLPDLYLHLGKSCSILNKVEEAEKYFISGIKTKPTFRDNYVELGNLYYRLKRYEDCIKTINEGLLRSRREYCWLETDAMWSWKPWDILCLAYWKIGAKDMSLACAKMAAAFNPTDQRLQNNVIECQKGVL